MLAMAIRRRALCAPCARSRVASPTPKKGPSSKAVGSPSCSTISTSLPVEQSSRCEGLDKTISSTTCASPTRAAGLRKLRAAVHAVRWVLALRRSTDLARWAPRVAQAPPFVPRGVAPLPTLLTADQSAAGGGTVGAAPQSSATGKLGSPTRSSGGAIPPLRATGSSAVTRLEDPGTIARGRGQGAPEAAAGAAQGGSCAAARAKTDPDLLKIRQIMRLLGPGQALAQLSDFAKEAGDEAFCRRLLKKYDGNVHKCEAKFKVALQWREQHREIIISRRFRVSGDCRILGLDAGRHPIIYFCMANQILPGRPGLDHLLVQTLNAIDMMPAGVEKFVQIWDLHGLRMYANLNPAPLLSMVASTESYFAERMHEVLIIDLPRVATVLKDAVWPYVPEKTRRKIHFATAAEAEARIRERCDGPVADRILASMAANRDPKLSIEDRRQTWEEVDRNGKVVPAFS